MRHEEEQKERVYISVDRDGWTDGLQLSIGIENERGGGLGFRIFGPKYNGSSKTLKRHILSLRDVAEIERYCAKAKALLSPVEGAE